VEVMITNYIKTPAIMTPAIMTPAIMTPAIMIIMTIKIIEKQDEIRIRHMIYSAYLFLIFLQI
jgi:hypothetical protein